MVTTPCLINTPHSTTFLWGYFSLVHSCPVSINCLVLLWRANPCPPGYLQTKAASECCAFCFSYFHSNHELKKFYPSPLHFITTTALLLNSVSSWMKHGVIKTPANHQGHCCLHSLGHTIHLWLLDLSKDWGDQSILLWALLVGLYWFPQVWSVLLSCPCTAVPRPSLPSHFSQEEK